MATALCAWKLGESCPYTAGDTASNSGEGYLYLIGCLMALLTLIPLVFCERLFWFLAAVVLELSCFIWALLHGGCPCLFLSLALACLAFAVFLGAKGTSLPGTKSTDTTRGEWVEISARHLRRRSHVLRDKLGDFV